MKKSDELPLLSDLQITAESIYEDAQTLPSKFMEAAKFRVTCMRNLAAADMAHDMARAQADLEIRQEAEDSGEKITEAKVKAAIDIHPMVLPAREKFHEEEALSEHSKLLVEAFRIKRDCLDILSRLTITERSIDSNIREHTKRLEKVRADLAQKYPKNRR